MKRYFIFFRRYFRKGDDSVIPIATVETAYSWYPCYKEVTSPEMSPEDCRDILHKVNACTGGILFLVEATPQTDNPGMYQFKVLTEEAYGARSVNTYLVISGTGDIESIKVKRGEAHPTIEEALKRHGFTLKSKGTVRMVEFTNMYFCRGDDYTLSNTYHINTFAATILAGHIFKETVLPFTSVTEEI